MRLNQSIELCHDVEVGPSGLSGGEIETALVRTEAGLTLLRDARRTGAMPLLELPDHDGDLAGIREAADWLADGASDVIILGTGGSSLGGQTLAQVGGWRLPVAGEFIDRPRLHFLDNLDPLTFAAALDALDLDRTKVLVVSKSGGTGETLMQTIAMLSAFEEAGLKDRIADRMLALTEPVMPGRLNKLHKLVEPLGVRMLDHHPEIGGRYSALSNVGLIPAAMMGLDIKAIRRGAAEVLRPVLDGAPPADCAPAVGAAVAVALAERRSLRINVMMAYADRLERFTRWWVQLWSESLGKQGRGMTAVPAIGPVDQHSALQLFLDGPADKFFTIVTTRCGDLGPRIDPALATDAGQPEFAGRTIGDLVAAQQRATTETLARNGRPVRVINVEQVDDSHAGALLMHFFLETILAAHLLGIDAFDQPAVEEGKVLARTYLTKL
jgi:glucose-6-phosphate isomerase